MQSKSLKKFFLRLVNHLISNLRQKTGDLLTITIKTRSSFKDLVSFALMSEIEPKMIDEALKYYHWIIEMKE